MVSVEVWFVPGDSLECTKLDIKLISCENGGAKRGRGLSAFVLVTATGRRQEIFVSIYC